jgi:hypothetical protein
MAQLFAGWVACLFAKPRAPEFMIEPMPEALAAWRTLLGAAHKNPDS